MKEARKEGREGGKEEGRKKRDFSGGLVVKVSVLPMQVLVQTPVGELRSHMPQSQRNFKRKKRRGQK